MTYLDVVVNDWTLVTGVRAVLYAVTDPVGGDTLLPVVTQIFPRPAALQLSAGLGALDLNLMVDFVLPQHEVPQVLVPLLLGALGQAFLVKW